jgi:hypothetical protein
MEVNNVIIGAKLSEIQKKPDKVKLVFENNHTKKNYTLTFNGFLLETSDSVLNKRVKNIQFDNVLGFRVFAHLRDLNRNPQNYTQMYIQMEGSNEEKKRELLGAVRNYKISSRKVAQ